jgi:TorA maturation chaperone TorD
MENLSTEIFEVRPPIYGLLANLLYSEPSSETLGKARKQLGRAEGAVALWNEPGLAASVQNFLNALARSTQEDLAVDYAGLFLGGKEGLICPSESSYLENKVYGEATLKVIEVYGKQGFVKEDAFHEPDDHIAVECAFMSTLGWDFIQMVQEKGMDAPACQENVKLQLDFLEEHLLNWIPDWAKQVQDFSETDFYRALAGLTQTWIEADQRLLVNSLRTYQNLV